MNMPETRDVFKNSLFEAKARHHQGQAKSICVATLSACKEYLIKEKFNRDGELVNGNELKYLKQAI